MERTLVALRQDAAASIIHDLRQRIADEKATRVVADAARALVEEARRHARVEQVADGDIDEGLWKSLVVAVSAWQGDEMKGGSW